MKGILTPAPPRPPDCWRCPRPSSRCQTATSEGPKFHRERSPNELRSSCPPPAAARGGRTCNGTTPTDASVRICPVTGAHVCVLLPYGVDHTEAHLHTAASVSSLRLRHSSHTIVTITQDLNTQTLVLLFRRQTGFTKKLTAFDVSQGCFTAKTEQLLSKVMI